jgi:sulfite dehydrogenase
MPMAVPGRRARTSVRGIAWDGGYGIRVVEVSTDGGKTWTAAVLGEDLGKFAFRTWSFGFAPKRGTNVVMARAINAVGQSQAAELIPNPAGYHHNLMHAVTLVGA